MRPRRRRDQDIGLERARRSLEGARAQHREQAGKRKREQAGVIASIERLAEANHLAALVWDVLLGGGQK